MLFCLWVIVSDKNSATFVIILMYVLCLYFCGCFGDVSFCFQQFVPGCVFFVFILLGVCRVLGTVDCFSENQI